MANLNSNWITEKLIDFEYKKYVLLAYLKEINEHFKENRLYPYLTELFGHYRQVKTFKENQENLSSAFPQRLAGFDAHQWKLTYEKFMEDDSLMNEILTIIEFSIPKFEYYLAEGKKIYDFIEEQLKVYPVGIVPLNSNNGYLMLKDGKTSDTDVYEYQITIFDQPTERFRGIHTNYVRTYTRSITNTYESIKNNLIKSNSSMPNPATYVIESDIKIPMEHTFLPIAKRALVKFIAVT